MFLFFLVGIFPILKMGSICTVYLVLKKQLKLIKRYDRASTVDIRKPLVFFKYCIFKNVKKDF